MQPEAIPHRQAQSVQKRNAEVAEALSRGNAWITVVMEFEFLPRQPVVVLGHSLGVADVVMWTYEERVVRIIEKRSGRPDFCDASSLLRPRRVETDDDECIDTTEKFPAESAPTSSRLALSATYRIPGP
jgi:hypothetical protein